MLSLIRRILLKSKRVQRAVLTCQVRQQKQRHHENWKLIMKGSAVRDAKTEKTEARIYEHELCVDYPNRPLISQNHVRPLFIDSTNWGGMK